MVKILYFARLREALGTAGEELELPANVTTVAGLMAWLAERGDTWRQEFDGCRPLRAAINQALATDGALVQNGDEVAFFPPVTGG